MLGRLDNADQATEAAQLHRSLARQLRRLGLDPLAAPAPWRRLLEVVSASYTDADNDRYTLERSIDISSEEMRALHTELSAQARHDTLTGLPNRASIVEHLGEALARSRRNGLDVALLFIDLDGFKLVNDSLGHAAGDELLIRAAERIRTAVRDVDVVARIGGDEFVVLSADLSDTSSANHVAARIVSLMEAPFRIGTEDAVVSASVGVALTGSTSSTSRLPDELMRRADMAMYRAKAQGRSQWVLFDEHMEAQAEDRLSTENALRQALTNNELRLYYQPLVRLADEAVTGFEALIRWERPGRGLVGPGDFIPIAEQSRLITAIGNWVVTEACAQASLWPDGQSSVSVNMTARDLAHPDFVANVTNAIQRSGVCASRLTVEVTETTLLADSDVITNNITRLRNLGVRVAIDDFGTGYSSLSYLRRLPAQVLKVDRAFVCDVDIDDSAAAIIGAVVTMGHALGLEVVAEGVERASQASALRMLGCDSAQGNHFARPMPIECVGPLLLGRSGAASSAA